MESNRVGLWNEPIESLSLEDVWRTVGRPRFVQQVRAAWEASAFWRETFSKHDLRASDLDDGLELSALPFIEKRDLLDDQSAHPPFGTMCAVPLSSIRRVHQTSGTTSRPLYVALTANDVANTIDVGARAFRCAGLRPDDVVVHCLNYCLWSGGLTDHLCLEETGATVIPFGVGNSRLLLETIQRIQPTAISCTPTYLNTLAELLAAEFDREPRELGLKKALLGGEPGLQSPGFRKALEDRWGVEAIDANYGASEVLSIFGSECRERTGLHWHGYGVLHCELINPDTRETVSIEPGAVGELVFTTLLREAQPLFRYRSHDVVQVTGVGPCGCGRNGFRFLVLGRSDNMVIVKGVNVFPEALQQVFSRYADQLTGEYRVVLRQPGPYDRLPVEVEARRALAPAERDVLKARLERHVRQSLVVNVELTWVEEGTLPKGEGKTARLVRLSPGLTPEERSCP
jgi:phenylacetate-CoA ligase